MNIRHILRGWFNLIVGRELKLMRRRLRICKSCTHNYYGVCNLCGCPLKAKASEPDESCEINKW
jgi:hypothetical protein